MVIDANAVRRRRCAAILLGVLIPLGPAVAGDGADLFRTRQCHTCHGDDGNTPALPLYPRLAGQGVEYLYRQMLDIRDGRRTNGLSAAMRATMSSVPDDELLGIAQWLAGRR